MLRRIVPKIFYSNLQNGIDLFVNALGFSVAHEDREVDRPVVIVERDHVVIYLIEDADLARENRPEIRIETDDIEGLYHEVKARNKDMLDPDSDTVKLRPWGCKDFALRDASGVSVVIHQW